MRDNKDMGPERLFARRGDGTATHGFAEAVAAGLSSGTLSTHVAARDSSVPARPGGAPGVGAELSPLSLSLDQQRATVTFATGLSPKKSPSLHQGGSAGASRLRGTRGPRWVPWSFPGNAACSRQLLCKVVGPGVVSPSME